MTDAASPTAPRALHVAALQMVSTPVVADNLVQAASLLQEAKARGAELALLPEYFCILGMRDIDKVAVAETDGAGPIQEFLATQARGLGLWIIGGTLPLRTEDAARVWNSSLVFDPSGRRIARYDKIHLFRFERGTERYDESRTLRAGSQTVSFDAPCGKIGLSICYDVRFPELYRTLGDCALMVVPSAFTAITGAAHWEVLLRARAIENQCYILAAAQGGLHPNGRTTHGDTLLIDPWGSVVDRLATGPGVVSGMVDPEVIERIRAGLPALQHRRL
ncbi:MAG: carbon-nitrogen hydrolase family protein [Betaproteobacteria bacterium]